MPMSGLKLSRENRMPLSLDRPAVITISFYYVTIIANGLGMSAVQIHRAEKN